MHEKNLEVAYLLDYYGGMLTEKQREVVELYYNEDLSLSEIAENSGISRQGERLLAPIRAYVAANCFGGHDRTPPVIECARLGNEAGIIGAAAL